jgi:hypothetical protein
MSAVLSPLVCGNSAAVPSLVLADGQEQSRGAAFANCGEAALVDRSRGSMVTIGSAGKSSRSMTPREAFHREQRATCGCDARAEHALDQMSAQVHRAVPTISEYVARRTGWPSGSSRPLLASLAMAYEPVE